MKRVRGLWPSQDDFLNPYPRPLYRPGHHTRHAQQDGLSDLLGATVTVQELYRRLAREQHHVRPIRQCVAPGDGSRPYLEQIDVYGRRTLLGRTRMPEGV